ncbi:muscle M-line assembly protein unc-89-like [Elysia marginata]|uniref:Muscle M-line assembly protein unc-89-like n=1 Tax=Elysia marginata TaxID=1093978 RepID=A0AAV4JTG8_9GAST|nr:muscle M-line assembly protein unc-89-like [Elysia marginata]
MPGQTVHYVGGTKHFECRVKGHPRPTIRWFKDDLEITDSPRYQFGHAHDGVISMVIEDIVHEDEGHYRCRAENSEGLASTSAYLFVRTHKEHPEEAETSIHAMKIEQARTFTDHEKKQRRESLVRQDSGENKLKDHLMTY